MHAELCKLQLQAAIRRLTIGNQANHAAIIICKVAVVVGTWALWCRHNGYGYGFPHGRQDGRQAERQAAIPIYINQIILLPRMQRCCCDNDAAFSFVHFSVYSVQCRDSRMQNIWTQQTAYKQLNENRMQKRYMLLLLLLSKTSLKYSLKLKYSVPQENDHYLFHFAKLNLLSILFAYCYFQWRHLKRL